MLIVGQTNGKTVHELAGQLGRLVPRVAVGAEDEVRLQAGHVVVDLGEVLDHALELVAAGLQADARLVRVVGPGLDTRRDEETVGLLEAVQSRTAENRKRALHEVRVAPSRRHLFDDVQHLVEAHAEVRVVKGDDDARQALGDVAQIGEQPLARQRHVVVLPVDAEVAAVGAAETGEQRDVGEPAWTAAVEAGDLDLRHSLGDGGELLEDVAARRHASRRELVVQDARHERLVTVVNHEVEESKAVGGEGGGVRAAEHGAGAASSVDLGQRIGQGARLGVRGQKHHVEVARQQVLGRRLPVEGRIVHFVSELAAPGRDGLRHDAGVVPAKAAIEVVLDPAAAHRIRQDLENADAQSGPPWLLGAGYGIFRRSPSLASREGERAGPLDFSGQEVVDAAGGGQLAEAGVFSPLTGKKLDNRRRVP